MGYGVSGSGISKVTISPGSRLPVSVAPMPSWPISVERPQQLRNSPAWNILTCNRTSITNRGKRRVKGLAGPELATGAEVPPSAEAAAARAFVSLSMQSCATRPLGPRLHTLLIAVQQVPRFEWQLAGEFY